MIFMVIVFALFYFLCFLALRIHVSSETCKILKKFGSFELELRGQIEIKVRELPNFVVLKN